MYAKNIRLKPLLIVCLWSQLIISKNKIGAYYSDSWVSTPDGAKDIANALRFYGSGSLTSLDLYGNRIDSEGIKAITDTLHGSLKVNFFY